MTPDDIRSQGFGRRLLWGLIPEEVSAFLDDVGDAYDNAQKWNASLTARVRELETEIQALEARETPASTHIEVLRSATLREVEKLVHDAQARAQTLIDEAKERATAMLQDAEAAKAQLQIEAEEYLAKATDRAESLLMTAREQEAAIRSEIDGLTQSRLQLVDDIRAALDTYQKWLATVDPRGRARGRREALEMSKGDDESVSASGEARVG